MLEFVFQAEIPVVANGGPADGLSGMCGLIVRHHSRDVTRDDVKAIFDAITTAFEAKMATMAPDLKGTLQ